MKFEKNVKKTLFFYFLKNSKNSKKFKKILKKID